ncbi:hypothetical protein PBI_OMNICRON_84 [Mycobacterium phage Omnicron]|uniref:Uncharacterized protein n=2 Tax=Kratiovirus TaxID=2948788 RepID=A0A088FRJ0_9CAUD|nr:hypothetical protein PBI_OMNICRON_84 [Mycobacterium phage Omnicron]YP_009950979.1 hypothetical protein I5G75_gp15 [Mycobacterium phage Rando14]AIM50417.1 hypothetical protein PBI_OMNICRON_84 [Mycobacterium phage Omnicron]AXQ53101.1 hypothetical protein SEA_RANDO14_81 [Mycobacterium phage Rando14]
MTDHKAHVHLRADNGSVAALHVGNITLGSPDNPTGLVLDGTMKPVGRMSADGIEIKYTDRPDVSLFGDEKLRTLQDRRDISFSLNLERVNPAAWHAAFGAPPAPAPTLRSAAIDACAALRTLLCVLRITLRVALLETWWRLDDLLLWSWIDPLRERWEALRRYPWRRLPGYEIRLWDKEFTHLYTEHGKPEPLRKWARRTTSYAWKVLRHG